MGAEEFPGVLIGTKSLFCSAPFDANLDVMPHTASRRPLLSAIRRSRSRRTPHVQQYTSTLVIPCAH